MKKDNNLILFTFGCDILLVQNANHTTHIDVNGPTHLTEAFDWQSQKAFIDTVHFVIEWVYLRMQLTMKR